MVAEALFEDAGGERTRYVARAMHWDWATIEEHERMGFHEGWDKSVTTKISSGPAQDACSFDSGSTKPPSSTKRRATGSNSRTTTAAGEANEGPVVAGNEHRGAREHPPLAFGATERVEVDHHLPVGRRTPELIERGPPPQGRQSCTAWLSQTTSVIVSFAGAASRPASSIPSIASQGETGFALAPQSPAPESRAVRSKPLYLARSHTGRRRSWAQTWPPRTSCSFTMTPLTDTRPTTQAYWSRQRSRISGLPPRTSLAIASPTSRPQGRSASVDVTVSGHFKAFRNVSPCDFH